MEWLEVCLDFGAGWVTDKKKNNKAKLKVVFLNADSDSQTGKTQNRQHLKYFRNVCCVTTNQSKDQHTQTSHKTTN